MNAFVAGLGLRATGSPMYVRYVNWIRRPLRKIDGVTAFGLEGIDFGLLHDQLLGFTELVNRVGVMDQGAVAGEIPAERARRAAGAPPCPGGFEEPSGCPEVFH